MSDFNVSPDNEQVTYLSTFNLHVKALHERFLQYGPLMAAASSKALEARIDEAIFLRDHFLRPLQADLDRLQALESETTLKHLEETLAYIETQQAKIAELESENLRLKRYEINHILIDVSSGSLAQLYTFSLNPEVGYDSMAAHEFAYHELVKDGDLTPLGRRVVQRLADTTVDDEDTAILPAQVVMTNPVPPSLVLRMPFMDDGDTEPFTPEDGGE